MAENDTAVVTPNLGLYLGRPPFTIPKRGMTDCLNVRISQGRVVRNSMGWQRFPSASSPINLDSKPVLLIDRFVTRAGDEHTIFGNTNDLFLFDDANNTVSYLTPREETGTVSVTNGSATVTGSGTSWSTTLKIGDYIHVGQTGQTNPGAIWYEINNIVSDTELELTENYQEASASGQDYTARSVFLGDIRAPFDTEVFYNATGVTQGSDGDRWYATNGIDPVVAWDGSTDQVYRPDLGNLEAARFVRRYKNTLVFGNLVVDGELRPYSVRTSSIGEPENVETGDSAEFIIHDGSDELLTAMQLGEALIIYAERSATVAQFVGPPLMYTFRTAISGFGPRSSRAVAQFPDHHMFLGPDAQYAFDGSTAQRLNNHVWQEVTRQVSPQRLDLIQTQFDEESGELLWVVPLNSDADSQDGNPETAFVQHYLEPVGEREPTPFTKRELPATAAGFYNRPGSLTWSEIAEQWQEFNYRWNDQFFQASFPQIMFGDADGNLYLLNESATKAGTALESFVRFSRRVLSPDSATKGIVRRIYPYIEHIPSADHDIRVRLRTADRADEPSQEVTDLPFPVAGTQTQHFIAPRKSARYIEVEFGTVNTTDYWAVSGYDFDMVKGSGR